MAKFARNRKPPNKVAPVKTNSEQSDALTEEGGAGFTRDAVRLVVYVTDMGRLRPLVNQVQSELWGGGPYPPRTIVEVRRLNQNDILEVEGTFFAPPRK